MSMIYKANRQIIGEKRANGKQSLLRAASVMVLSLAFLVLTPALWTVQNCALAQDNGITGRLKAWRSGKVSTQIPGLVKALKVPVGARVKVGDILAVLDISRMKQDLAQAKFELAAARAKVNIAKAERDLAQNIFSRQKKLRRSAAFQKARYDEAALKLKISKANVRQSIASAQIREAIVKRKKLDIALSTIRAPYSGVIVRIFAQPGTFVTAEEPHIVEMVDDSSLEIEVDISAALASGFKKKDIFFFHVNGGKKYRASFRAVLPYVNRREQTRPIRLSPLNPSSTRNMAIGQNVTVILPRR